MRTTLRTMELWVHEAPVPKGRPRSRVATSAAGRSFVQVYTPKATAKFEERVRRQARALWRGKPTLRPVEVVIEFWLPPAPSWADWRKDAAVEGLIGMTGKPDLDNYEKSVIDALNGLVYHDDAQIVTSTTSKRYGRRAGFRVEVRELATVPARVSTKKGMREWMTNSSMT